MKLPPLCLNPEFPHAFHRSMDRVDETVLNYDLIEDVLILLIRDGKSAFLPPEASSPLSGAVLIFLPGIGEIRALTERLLSNRMFADRHKFSIIPLHSTLSSAEQKLAFEPSRQGCRKIIISTNIAETR